MRNKLFTLLFAVIFGTNPFSAAIIENVEIDQFVYNLDSETKTAILISPIVQENCTGALEIPDTVTYQTKHYGVKNIQSSAFSGCTGITSVSIPNTVTYIGNNAFSKCDGLESVTLSNSLISIEPATFKHCSSLTSIDIPNSVTSIGEYAFFECFALNSVIIGDGVTTIDYGAFGRCWHLQSVTIGNSVKTIKNYAFSECGDVQKVNIKDITAWCAIQFGNMESNPLNIVTYLYLNGKAVTELVIPDNVTDLHDNVFEGCRSLCSVKIPATVQTIGEYAFSCYNLNFIEFGSVIPIIDENAFSTPNLTHLAISAPIPPSDAENWGIKNTSCNLYVPTDYIEAYKGAAWWGGFATINPIEDFWGKHIEFNPAGDAIPESKSMIVGKSYTVSGTYNAGQGYSRRGNMFDYGVKFRINKPVGDIANAIEFKVNEGSQINKFFLIGIANSDKSATIGTIYVDGKEYKGEFDGLVPSKENNSHYSSNIVLDNIQATKSLVFVFSELNDNTQAAFCYKIEYSDYDAPEPEEPEDQVTRAILDLNIEGIVIDDWTLSDATLNESGSDVSKSKYAYDIKAGIPSISYVTSKPRFQFQISNSSDKAKAFYVYPGKCYEYGGKNGIINILETEKGDTIKIDVAAKGSTAGNFKDPSATYPLNAIALSEDLTLPAKGSAGGDSNGYTWRTLEFLSRGGDVALKEFSGGFRIRLVEVVHVELNSPTDILSVEKTQDDSVRKLLRNGQILILRGDKVYTLTGQEVR